MKPERASRMVLSTTRSTAKMHEFRVAPEDFIDLPRDPAILFSTAIGMLGEVSAMIADRLAIDGAALPLDPALRPPGWEADTDPIESLRFASLFFDAYLNAKLNLDVAPDFTLLCAASYYLSGNVGSAAVVARETPAPEPAFAGGLGRCLLAILRNELDLFADLPELIEGLLASLRAYLAFEQDEQDVIARALELRTAYYDHGTARELFYADVIVATCAFKLRNAARTLLPASSELDPVLWQPALLRPGFPTELWPAQQRIVRAGLLAGRAGVIQMPTSAGKTRATELIIRAAFLSGRAHLAVIVAPYRSLCHDIRGDLSRAFAGEGIKLNEATDAFQPDIVFDELAAEPSVLIVTPEKLLYILRRMPELAQQIGLAIFDEGHQFEGLTRGPTYELLLTSLRMALTPHTQIVLISAVIGNAPQISEWLLGDANLVVDGVGLSSTTRSVAFASWEHARGQLAYVSPVDPDEREFFVPRLFAETQLANFGAETADRRFPTRTDGGDIALYLGLHLVPNGSVAIFCGRKDSATKLGRRLVEIERRGISIDQPMQASDANEIARLKALYDGHLGADASASQAAAFAVLTHHADTPPGIKLSIEHAMKANLARIVICTSTLAQGVNFPIKYLLVTSTQQGVDRIKVRDFQNLMGRAGRAGMHTESSVIFSTPKIYDDRAHPLQWRRRDWAFSKHLLDPANSEPCGSGLLELFEDYQQRQPPIVQNIRPEWLDLAFADAARIEQVVAAAIAVQNNISADSFRPFIEARARAVQNIAAFLIAHMDFADDEQIAERVKALAENTLAYYIADEPTRAKLITVFQTVATAIGANADGDLRVIIRKSPLPPATIAALQGWLTANIDALTAALAEDSLPDMVITELLSHNSARSIRSVEDQNVVPELLRLWSEGASYHAIFEILRDRNIRFGARNATVEDAVALCENGFAYDVAMIAASLADLAEPLEPEFYEALSWIQRRLKYGLPAPAQAAFFEAGFADRIVATALAAQFPLVETRYEARQLVREQAAAVEAVLAPFPSYFHAIARELAD